MGGEIIEKFKIGIIAICLIFLVGGCYAVYHGSDLANNVATDISSSPNADNVPSNDVNNQPNNLQNDNINTVKDLSQNNIINTVKDLSQNNNINNFASALEIRYRNIPGTEIFVNNDIDYTDLYVHCVACGGFLALGEVTKALPEDALCPDVCGGHSINDNTDYTVTYEFAKEFYDKHGRHPEEIGEENTPEIQNTGVATDSDNVNVPAVIGSGIHVPDDYVVYDILEVNPKKPTADSIILHRIDMPIDSDLPISIYDMNNPNQHYEPGTVIPIESSTSDEPIAVHDVNNPNGLE